jgi:magnesium chelatase family protein
LKIKYLKKAEIFLIELRDGTPVDSTTSLTYPARFMLVGSMNPCPCGYYSDPNNERACNIH